MCSKHLDEGVLKAHLQYFVMRMQYSGYSQEIRYEVLARAYRIKDRPCETNESEQNGGRAKKRKKKNWYNEEKYDGVMFVAILQTNYFLCPLIRDYYKSSLSVVI